MSLKASKNSPRLRIEIKRRNARPLPTTTRQSVLNTVRPHAGGAPDGEIEAAVRPSAQRAVQLVHQLCGILPCPRSDCQRVDVFHHALDTLLRWPVSQAPGRFSLNTSARTNTPGSRTPLPAPCRFVSCPR